MSGLDLAFALMVAAALTLALRDAVRALGSAWGADRDREVGP